MPQFRLDSRRTLTCEIRFIGTRPRTSSLSECVMKVARSKRTRASPLLACGLLRAHIITYRQSIMSGANGTNPSPRAPARSKQSTQLKEFLILGKKLFLEKDPEDYDQLLDEKHELERKLLLKSQEFDAKVEELSTLRAANSVKITQLEFRNNLIHEEFENRVILWNNKTTKQADLETKITRLQQELKQVKDTAKTSQAKIESLQGKLNGAEIDLADAKNNLKATKKELNSKDRELKGTLKDLEAAQTELEAQMSELGLENLPVEILATNLHTLADECHKMARKFFCTELPQDLVSNDFWRELEMSGFIRATPKRTPLTNSVAAQYLRTATAEKIIAEKLCSNIFRDYYLPQASSAQGILDDVLALLNERNPHKEAIFRLQLLAAYEPYEEDYVISLVESTIEEIVKILDPLLFTPDVREGFQSALRRLLVDAVKLWRPVQRSASKGWVSNDPEIGGFRDGQDQIWDSNEEYDKAVELSEDQKAHIPDQADPLISLFPQLSVGEKSVYRGCALWSDQNAVVAANTEFNQWSSRNSAQGRGLARRDSDKRRVSFSGSPVLGRRGEDSPRSPLGNQSFLEHTNSRTNNRRMTLPAAPLEEGSGGTGGE